MGIVRDDIHNDEIVALHAARQSQPAIAKALGCSVGLVRKRFADLGLVAKNPRHGTLNEDRFAKIDDEESAYWLGFLYADGSISPRGGIRLRLKASDAPTIQAFADYMETSNNLHRDRDLIGVSIGSRQVAANLAQWNVVPNMMHTATPPTLDWDLQRHFWRGVFDGDGSFGVNSSSGNWVADMTGTIETTTAYTEYLDKALGIGLRKCSRKGPRLNTSWNGKQYMSHGSWSVKFHGNRIAPKVAHHFYHDAKVFLPRKMALYQKMVEEGRLEQ